MHLIEDHAEKVRIPVRFAASKVMEGDTKILEQLKLTANEQHVLEEIAKQTEEETGMDRAAAVARCVLIISRISAARLSSNPRKARRG